MKKGFIFAALTLVVMLFASCNFALPTKATVNVTVKSKLGIPQSGIVVYMFSADNWEGSYSDVDFASARVVTEDDGVAVFNLSVVDLELLDDQTTLYFAVFDNEGDIRGSTAVTVKKGDNKRVDLTLDK